MFADANPSDATLTNFVVLAVILGIGVYLRRRPRAGTAYGSAKWATERLLRRRGLLGPAGLVVGRSLGGSVIRLNDFCHCLLVGGTGSGKGVGVVVPTLLTYFTGSLVVFDPKGDLYALTSERRRKAGHRVVRLAPFGDGGDGWNPLDDITDGPLLVDQARAVAESLVLREGAEPDPHWNNKAVQVITALLTLVLTRMAGAERNLSSVQDIASDVNMLAAAAAELRKMPGIPGRLGSQLGTLFDPGGGLSKEGASVLSTVARHLSFLDSGLVARSLEKSDFDVARLLAPGLTVYLQIPPHQLEAQRGLLRCWVSSLVRAVNAAGDEHSTEVLFLLDEASALNGLGAIEEALVRGRSGGARLLLAYQPES